MYLVREGITCPQTILQNIPRLPVDYFKRMAKYKIICSEKQQQQQQQ